MFAAFRGGGWRVWILGAAGREGLLRAGEVLGKVEDGCLGHWWGSGLGMVPLWDS